jgi:peptide subunit release factor 1 (eRF1)
MQSYKELPCRRCGRVWKWAFDKKTVPYCPEGHGCAVEEPSMKDLLDEIIRKLDRIEAKIRSQKDTDTSYEDKWED